MWNTRSVCAEEKIRQTARQIRKGGKELDIIQYESSFPCFLLPGNLLSGLQPDQFPTDKTIRLRDETAVSEALLILGTAVFFTAWLHISNRRSLITVACKKSSCSHCLLLWNKRKPFLYHYKTLKQYLRYFWWWYFTKSLWTINLLAVLKSLFLTELMRLC